MTVGSFVNSRKVEHTERRVFLETPFWGCAFQTQQQPGICPGAVPEVLVSIQIAPALVSNILLCWMMT